MILKYHSSSSILITKMINDDDSVPQPIKTDVVEQKKEWLCGWHTAAMDERARRVGFCKKIVWACLRNLQPGQLNTAQEVVESQQSCRKHQRNLCHA